MLTTILGEVESDEHIRLEAVGDGLRNILYYQTLLERLDERTGRITGVAT